MVPDVSAECARACQTRKFAGDRGADRSLKLKGIKGKAALKDSCLYMVLESAQIPDRKTLVPFIRQGLRELEVKAIKTVKVYGRQVGREFSAWINEFELRSEVHSSLPAATGEPTSNQDQPLSPPVAAKPEGSNGLSKISKAEVKRLGTYLVEADLLTEAQVQVALADQKVTGIRFGEILVARGWVKQKTIEYLIEKVISPEQESAKRELSSLESEQPLDSRGSAPSLPTQPDRKLLHNRETLVVDGFFT